MATLSAWQAAMHQDVELKPCHNKVKTSFPHRKALRAILCSAFNAKIQFW